MTDTVQAGATLLLEPQQQPSTPINAALQRLDCFASRIPVKSRTTAAPPGSPTEGDRYLIPTGASGDWSSHVGAVTVYLSGWKYFTPKEGWAIRVDDEDLEVTYDGTNWLGSGADLSYDVQLIKTEFPSFYFGTPFSSAQNGAGAGHTMPVPTAGRPGGVSLDTGTTTTGVAACYFPSTITVGAGTGIHTVLLGGGRWTMEWVVEIPTLSTAGEEYVFRVGFKDTIELSVTDGTVDGVFFEYDRTASVNWRMCAVSNSTPTKTSSSTAVATGRSKLKIVVNAAASSVEFFVNDVSIGTISTNIPSGAGRDTGVVAIINKSAGTTSRSVILDAVDARCKLTTKR